MPWEGDQPPFGFTHGDPWLPMPPDWAAKTVALQEQDPDSLLGLYRRAIHARKALPVAGLEWLPSEEGVLRFRRGPVEVVVNLSGDPVVLPNGRLLLASERVVKDLLPNDAAAWLEVE